MPSRRKFAAGVAAGTIATVFAPAVLRAAPVKMRVGLASGVNDAQVAFQSIGMHPRLNWYKDEGIEMEILNTGTTTQPLQLLTAGQIEFATIAPGTLIPPFADNPNLGVICNYMWMPRIHNGVVVKPDSAVQTFAELKGKTIGIRNTGDSGYFYLQAAFKELGIDPQKDVEWLPVGNGGQAGQALYNNTVQAIAIWDAEFARIEIAGFKLRHLPNLPSAQELFGNSYAASTTTFTKMKAEFGRMYRAIAKGQIFTALNPRAAVLLHWDLFPETKAKGKSDAESMGDMLKLLEIRHDKWFPHPASPDQRMGASTEAQWKASVRYMGLLNPSIPDKIKDVSKLYTNEAIEVANQFDRAAFEAFAKTFTV